MAVQLLRNARVWVSTVSTGHDVTNTFEIQVKDDLAWSQDNNTSTVEISEAGATPTRGTAEFNDSLNPADWSFTTYIRPYEVDPNSTPDDGDEYKITPDAMMWHSLATGAPYDPVNGSAGVTTNKTNMLVKFTNNQYHELLKLNLYILADNLWYVITDVQVGEANVSNDITAIGEVTWSGQGTTFTKLGSEPFDPANVTSVDCNLAAPYIKNKLTILKVKDNSGATKTYDVPITGGSVTFGNNITYLTPSTLACLDIPIGSFTGAFSVEGELTAYLDSRVGGTAELMQDLIAAKAVTTDFEIAIIMGGSYAAGAPAAVIVIPHAQVRIPTPSSDDVIGVSIGFRGVPTDFSAGDEAYLGFSDVYTTTEIDKLIADGDGDTP